VLCLPASGVLSALGLAAAERRRDASRSLLRPLAELDALERAAADLVRPRDGEELRAAADLRYAGQSFELLIPFADGDLAETFHREHERRYGHADPERPVELVTLRAAAVRPGADVRLSATGDAERSQRMICWDGQRIEALVLTGSGLAPGTNIEGPAVIEFPETTCLVPPGWSGGADEHGIVRLHT
jgi:N-methylhydantoinase A